MSNAVTYVDRPAASNPSIIALDGQAPRLEDLFAFMRDAELRIQTLRMRILEQTLTARGETLVTVDVILAHPGRARITRRRSTEPLGRDYDVWSSDGVTVTTYDARSERASVRPVRRRVVGATRSDLPRFSQVYVPLTALPAETLADTFIHPHGYIRNVLLTGPVALLGTTLVHGREAFVLRADHPRSTYVLTDRPDRWLEVGVDRQTGIILRLVERVGDTVTRHAEVTSLELDPAIPDEAFTVHLPEDVRRIY
jgi:outer membrane lipoprotein-sorting protein